MSRRLFGDATVYLGANILNAGIPFLLLPILTRVLSPADYGTVAIFGIMLSVFGAFTGLSVHGAIGVRYFQLERGQLAQYVGACTGILLFSTAIVGLLIVIGGNWLAQVSGIPEIWLLVAVVLSGILFLINIRLSLWQVSGKARQYGAFQVCQGISNGALSLLFVLAYGMAWEGRVSAQVIAGAIFGSIALYCLIREREIAQPQFARRDVTDALRFGMPLIPHVLGGLVIVSSDRLIITNMMSVDAAGVYTVSMQFGMILGLIADAFVKVYGPWLYKQLKIETSESRLRVVGATYFIWIGFLVVALVLTELSEVFLPYLVGKDFIGAGDYVGWFFIGQAFSGMYYSVAGFFFFSSKTSIVSIVTISAGAVSILSTLALVGSYGLAGASISYAAAHGVCFVIAWILSQRVSPMPWRECRSAIKVFLRGAEPR